MSANAPANNQDVELLPCPFCGGKAALHGARYMKKFPACTVCGAERGTVQEWNTRVTTDMRLAEAAAALEDQLLEQAAS